ncbi:hypothetical protein V8D89_015473 [Ganoderma adspersum]
MRMNGRDWGDVTKHVGMLIGIMVFTIGRGETVIGDLSTTHGVQTGEWMGIRYNKENGWIPNAMDLYVGGNGGDRKTSKAGGRWSRQSGLLQKARRTVAIEERERGDERLVEHHRRDPDDRNADSFKDRVQCFHRRPGAWPAKAETPALEVFGVRVSAVDS